MMSDVKDSFALYLNEVFSTAGENVSHHRTDLRSAPCAGAGGSEENERENFLTSAASSLTGKGGSLWNKNSPLHHHHNHLDSPAASSGILQQQNFGMPVSAATVPAVYVNPKQYKRIVIRRQNRLRLERLLSALKVSKRATPPYLHESRHAHAMKRQRGPGGRFMPVIGGGGEKERLSNEKEASLVSKSNENSLISKDNENSLISKDNENSLVSKDNENSLISKDNENASDSQSSSSSSNSPNDQVFALVHIK